MSPMLGPEDRDKLAAAGIERTFGAGDRLITIGAQASEVFYLLAGTVKIVVVSTHGTESVFGLRTAGEFVGEMSTLNDEPRSADVVAVDGTRAIMVSAARFTSFLEVNPHVALDMLRMQSRRLNEMTERSLLGVRSVRARVARRLLELSGGVDATPGNVVELTQNDLAQYIDASREWTSKELGELRREGTIGTGRGKVIVLDPVALQRVALEA